MEGTAIRNNNDNLFINEQIRDREVRVIGPDGEMLGIMSAMEARKLAEEADLDLVKISPGAKPPVCKIIDYGKYKYEKTRKEKDAKKKQHTVEIKEIRMSPNIDTNDLQTKINAARKFLTKGDRVKVTLRFRGREMAHMQQRHRRSREEVLQCFLPARNSDRKGLKARTDHPRSGDCGRFE